MKIKDQVLSIAQVQELQELGFDVKKFASMCWVKTNYEDFELNTLEICKYLVFTPTLTIGDIIDILPNRINTERVLYRIEINNPCVYYIDRINNNGIYFYEKKFIDNLFETIKWCIENKHILCQ